MFTITSKKEDNVIGFFGELNALSNFHPAEFELDGIKFPTSEHYIQYTKARMFGDNLAAANILNANTPADSKTLGWSINNFDKEKWDENAKSYCYPGIHEKFIQNKHLLDTLLRTKGHILVESTKDKVWGTGIVLSRDDWHDDSPWHSQGILGEMLCEMRDTYLHHHPDTIVQDVVYTKKYTNATSSDNATSELLLPAESLIRSKSQPELATLTGVPPSLATTSWLPTPTTGSTPNLALSTPPRTQQIHGTGEQELQGVPRASHEPANQSTYSGGHDVVSTTLLPNSVPETEQMETSTSLPMTPTQSALVSLSQEGHEPT